MQPAGHGTTNTIVRPNPTQLGTGPPGVPTNATMAPAPLHGIGQAAAITNSAPGAKPTLLNPSDPTILTLPPLVPYLSLFAITCHLFLTTDNLAEAHHTRNIYNALFHTPGTILNDCATILNVQSPPPHAGHLPDQQHSHSAPLHHQVLSASRPPTKHPPCSQIHHHIDGGSPLPGGPPTSSHPWPHLMMHRCGQLHPMPCS